MFFYTEIHRNPDLTLILHLIPRPYKDPLYPDRATYPIAEAVTTSDAFLRVRRIHLDIRIIIIIRPHIYVHSERTYLPHRILK